MRRKFFFISLLVLIATTVSVAGILLTYFRTERLSFLDDQIRQTATSIIESKLSELKTYDDEEADQIISEELGPDRLGKFFIVRTREGEILFTTQNVDLLEMEIPQDPKWITLTTPKHFVRVLNLKLPRFPTRTLQVGVIVDASFISLTYVNNRTMWAISGILLIILILTWFLSAYLFSPIKTLAQYLNQVTKSLEANAELPQLPVALSRYAKEAPFQRQDEFRNLIQVLNGMVEKINVSRKFMKSWTFQMAHELKTPLTIVNRDFEVISEKYKVDATSVQEVQSNIDKISQTVSSFLDWAELTTQKIPGNLYVVNIEGFLVPVLVNLKKIYGDRIQIAQATDFQILCNPLHLEQLLNNVLSNALKYSKDKVEISFHEGSFQVRDQGEGIPAEVLSRIGSPFNKSANVVRTQKGIGLGLAWVKTICDLYRWQYEFVLDKGTTFKVSFPPVISGS
nr:HAMP domain-containing sensor histidine kinase [uncultured Bdellovibrio sp.]